MWRSHDQKHYVIVMSLLDRAMKVSVMEGCEAGRKLGRVSEEVKEGEEELVRMRRERYKSLVHCRDLWAQIQVQLGIIIFWRDSLERAFTRSVKESKEQEVKIEERRRSPVGEY